MTNLFKIVSNQRHAAVKQEFCKCLPTKSLLSLHFPVGHDLSLPELQLWLVSDNATPC